MRFTFWPRATFIMAFVSANFAVANPENPTLKGPMVEVFSGMGVQFGVTNPMQAKAIGAVPCPERPALSKSWCMPLTLNGISFQARLHFAKGKLSHLHLTTTYSRSLLNDMHHFNGKHDLSVIGLMQTKDKRLDLMQLHHGDLVKKQTATGVLSESELAREKALHITEMFRLGIEARYFTVTTYDVKNSASPKAHRSATDQPALLNATGRQSLQVVEAIRGDMMHVVYSRVGDSLHL